MPSSILNGKVSHSILYPSQLLFSLPPQVFGCTCFVHDIRPHVSKLDPKSLKCVFLGYSRQQKGYRCYSFNLGRYIVSTDVTFFESDVFFSESASHSPFLNESEDEFLVYGVCSLSPIVESPRHSLPITHVYSRKARPVTTDNVLPDSSRLPGSSSVDPSLDLPIALRKGTRSCTSHPIVSYVSYTGLSPSLHSFIAICYLY